MFFISKYIKIIFFLFLKIIFNINTLKWSKNIKNILILKILSKHNDIYCLNNFKTNQREETLRNVLSPILFQNLVTLTAPRSLLKIDKKIAPSLWFHIPFTCLTSFYARQMNIKGCIGTAVPADIAWTFHYPVEKPAKWSLLQRSYTFSLFCYFFTKIS